MDASGPVREPALEPVHSLNPQPLPHLTIAESEEFFSTGFDACSAFPSEETLIDIPGVGLTPGWQLPYGPTRQPSQLPYSPGAVPFPLRAKLREELLCELIFASRDLASYSIRRGTTLLGLGALEICNLCHRSAGSGRPIEHKPTCYVGRVVSLIDGLVAGAVQPPVADPTRKEDAPQEESAAADLGKSSRPATLTAEYGEPWQYRVDRVLEITCVYDREGTLISTIDKADREAEEWADRIVRCVNALAGKAVGQ